METFRPSLIENEVKYNLNRSLKNIRNYKDKYITILVNIFLLVSFVVVVGGFLYYRYKGKPTPEILAQKNREKKYYLFEKLQKFAIDKQKENQNLITNLPL